MIRLWSALFIAGIVGLTIQASFVHTLSPAAVAPDLLLILVVYLGLRAPNVLGVLGAFVLGVMGDFASGQFVGPLAAGYVVAFSIIVYASDKIYAERGVAIAILTFLCSLAKSAAFLLMLAMYVEGIELLSVSLIRMCAVEALLTALCSPFVLRFFAWCVGARSVAVTTRAGSYHR